MVLTVPTFRIDPTLFDEKSDTLDRAIQKAMDAKAKWLESSLEKLTASGCINLVIEEHPTKTVITSDGAPVGTFMFTFVPTTDMRQHS
jgi:hypothetical protein